MKSKYIKIGEIEIDKFFNIRFIGIDKEIKLICGPDIPGIIAQNIGRSKISRHLDLFVKEVSK
jgi:hypothetical protein